QVLVEVAAVRLKDVLALHEPVDDGKHTIDAIDGQKEDIDGIAGMEDEHDQGKQQDETHAYAPHIPRGTAIAKDKYVLKEGAELGWKL
ncbi:hypothetical protein, partial [Parapedobacter tibetensis]|uniref:hypothetical protein n=1 Tax=Parapedobacter tibetensis TaxID=2972951 RepID=UPI00214D5A7F